ncbi:hypothetical protein JCM11251_005571 [Rhodosporidiobolus azoricus]
MPQQRLVKRLPPSRNEKRQALGDPAATDTPTSATEAISPTSTTPNVLPSTATSNVISPTSPTSEGGSSPNGMPNSFTTPGPSTAAPSSSSSPSTPTDDVSSPTFGPSSVISTQASAFAFATVTSGGVVIALSSTSLVTLTLAEADDPAARPGTTRLSAGGSGLSSSARAGAIAGGVVGGVLLLAAIGFLALWAMKRRRRSDEDEDIRWPEMGSRGHGGLAGYVAPTRDTGRRGFGEEEDEDEQVSPHSSYDPTRPPGIPSTRSTSPFQSTFYHSQPHAPPPTASFNVTPTGPTRQPTYASTVSALSRSNTAPTVAALPPLGSGGIGSGFTTTPTSRSATPLGGGTRPASAGTSSAAHGGGEGTGESGFSTPAAGGRETPFLRRSTEEEERDPEERQQVYSGAPTLGRVGTIGKGRLTVVNRGDEEWDD